MPFFAGTWSTDEVYIHLPSLFFNRPSQCGLTNFSFAEDNVTQGGLNERSKGNTLSPNKVSCQSSRDGRLGSQEVSCRL